jgi:hypothetical protein
METEARRIHLSTSQKAPRTTKTRSGEPPKKKLVTCDSDFRPPGLETVSFCYLKPLLPRNPTLGYQEVENSSVTYIQCGTRTG